MMMIVIMIIKLIAIIAVVIIVGNSDHTLFPGARALRAPAGRQRLPAARGASCARRSECIVPNRQNR